MSFTLDKVVPWGRSLDEYAAMFALTDQDLAGRILGCGDGPASFNAGMMRAGCFAVSADPLYVHAPEAIRQRIKETFAAVLDQARKNAHEFVWNAIPSVEELGRLRMAAMEEFLADFARPDKAGRYVAAAMPHLPFAGRSFDLALCSHFLFLYSEHLDLDFHLACIREMCLVAGEARVFPLLELGTAVSRHLDAVLSVLDREGYAVDVRRVDYEFQRGGNQMLTARPPHGKP